MPVVLKMTEENVPKNIQKIGDKDADGWIYAGISEDTGRPFFAAPKDMGISVGWYDALRAASALDAECKKNVRLPSRGELNQLFNARAAIGGFNETGFDAVNSYWSSAGFSTGSARAQSFKDGEPRIFTLLYDCAAVRFVRS